MDRDLLDMCAMIATTTKRTGLIVVLVLLASGSMADAGSSLTSLYRAFRGRLLVSEQPLLDAHGVGNARELKKRSVDELVSEDVDGVATWTFHYAAFLQRAPKTDEVSLDFHRRDKERTYVGNVVISVDPQTTIVVGDIEIDEDSGPAPGQTYDVVVRTRGLKKERELAAARISLR